MPVVARVGGLADTVIDANDAAVKAGVATGVQFADISAEGLFMRCARRWQLYRQPEVWRGSSTPACAATSAGSASAADTPRCIRQPALATTGQETA